MTKFEMNLNGLNGEFWKRNAEREIVKMQEMADNGEILLDGNCAAYWEKSGHYLPEECAEVLSHCIFFFDEEAMYPDVIELVKQWRLKFLSLGARFLWFCMPIRHYNCCNRLANDESFYCWEPGKEEVWKDS